MPKKTSHIDQDSKSQNMEGSLGGSFNAKVFSTRKGEMDVVKLSNQILQGDRIALAKGITLIESANPEDSESRNQLIELCFPHAKSSIRIGITGSPGVGKSTFIEVLGLQYLEENKKLAILTIDPSSSISGGSILGDKTRMQRLGTIENVFIRPSPAGQSLGGVARSTRETIMLCEAAGFDTIFIETVGVGQSEYVVESMTDIFVLLLLPGAGDELQGIKRGVVEMADLVIVNKADKDRITLAKQAQSSYNQALHLFPQKAGVSEVKVMLASALEGTGIKEVKEQIDKLLEHYISSGYLNKRRASQQLHWFEESLKNGLFDRFNNHPLIKAQKPQLIENIKNNLMSPFQAAEVLLKLFYPDK